MSNPARPFFRAAHLAVLACLFGLLPAQCPPGAPMPQDLAALSAVPVAGSAAAVRWNLGRQALAKGDHEVARKHLLAALELHPCSAAVLVDLLLAAGEDRDQQLLWAERTVRAAVDQQGRFKLDGATKKQIPASAELDAAHKLVKQRTQAIAEVARFAAKQRPSGKQNASRAQLAGFASELLLTLGDGAPGPLGAAAEKVRKVVLAIPPDYDEVLQGLLGVMRHVPAGDDDPVVAAQRSIRAARILVGLAAQAGFKDLQGPPPPDFGAVANQAREYLARLDQKAQAAAKIWTIAELEALSAADREAFTSAHDTWQHPGVAVSATGRYRIETTCGHSTLLGTAQTVELHHDRLATHFGKDPFAQRQGIIRVVPEDEDLETEGAPYWWAGGFQSGDRTTVRFAWQTIPDLGRTLTHELTHRFDGVLRPFLAAWYVEGHAVWTGGHYAMMADRDFVDDYLERGAVDGTWRKNYDRRKKFEELLSGTIEEYRDNYQAGYALYAYLRSYPPKAPPLFASALAKFEKNARGGQRDPVGYFTKTFCDGKDGRPASLDDFLVGWEHFLAGVGRHLADHRIKEHQWVAQYGQIEKNERGEEIMDRPTWSWARKREEPFFGQDHAARATRLLHEAGDHTATVAAGLWSISVDGWRPDTVLATVASGQQTRQPSAAQAIAALARTRFPGVGPSTKKPLAGLLPRTVTFVGALAERARELAAAGAPVAAAALAAEHDQLARRLDLPALAEPADIAASAPPAVPTHLGGHGWTETSLTTFDKKRQKGLWHATANGDLHVGREQPRDSTGTIDRKAHQRDAFAHTVSWQAPGAYTLRGRVHFTTSYVRGAVVFGHWRRDRGMRLRFTSGDFEYAVGREDTNRKFGRISFRLEGLWERDGRMPHTKNETSIRISDETAWFDYELQVCGPRVAVHINGEEQFTYAVHDGAPIEGHVGFAMGMGAIRVQEPTVQRLDAAISGAMIGLDMARQPAGPIEDLIDLPTRGIPMHADGTLVLWVPANREEFAAMALPRAMPTLANLLSTLHEHPAPWILAVPAAMAAAARKNVQSQVAAVRGRPLPELEHAIGEPFTGAYPWVLFVDGLGVLRAAADVSDTAFHTRVTRWSRRFRPR